MLDFRNKGCSRLEAARLPHVVTLQSDLLACKQTFPIGVIRSFQPKLRLNAVRANLRYVGCDDDANP